MGNSFDDQIAEVLKSKKTATIQEFNEAVRQAGLPDDFVRGATDSALNARIRRVISRTLGADGLKDFESVERETADGSTERVYVQLTLLDKEEYRRVVDNYVERASYMCRKANTLVLRGNGQHNTKRQLPFPAFGVLSDASKESA